MRDQWYKVLVDGKSCHGGNMAWPLPTDNGDGTFTPGAWVEVGKKADLELCVVGLHLTTDPTRWLKAGCQVYRAEGKRAGEREDDKQVFGKARLLAPAPDAIPDYWWRVEAFVLTDLPNWDFTNGAARDVAWDVAWAAAWAAAWDVAWGVTRDVAWDVTRDAARAAAWDVAWDVTRAAALDAARAAAWDVAWDVAWAAALYCCVEVLCADLPIADEHRQLARSLRAHYEPRWRAK